MFSATPDVTTRFQALIRTKQVPNFLFATTKKVVSKKYVQKLEGEATLSVVSVSGVLIHGAHSGWSLSEQEVSFRIAIGHLSGTGPNAYRSGLHIMT